MAPDLDVLIRSAEDPLLFLEYHRQFTHALAFVPVGALLCAAVAHPLARRWLSFSRTYLFCLLGYASHGVLDACTSYGTQLLWPFSDARLAWNLVSVIDPLFTVPLLALVAVAAVRRKPVLARTGLVWVLAYLALGLAQGWRAEEGARALAAARGHEPTRLLTKPSFGNLLVWKSVYAHGGRYYVDALRLGAGMTVYPGEGVKQLSMPVDLPWLVSDTQQGRDLARFRHFSDGYLALDPRAPVTVVDVRYSLLPNRADALWGIRLNPATPERHAAWVTDRGVTPEERRLLVEMITTPGIPLPRMAGGR